MLLKQIETTIVQLTGALAAVLVIAAISWMTVGHGLNPLLAMPLACAAFWLGQTRLWRRA